MLTSVCLAYAGEIFTIFVLNTSVGFLKYQQQWSNPPPPAIRSAHDAVPTPALALTPQHFLEKVHGKPPGNERREAEAQRTDPEEDGGDDGERDSNDASQVHIWHNKIDL